MTTVWGIKNIKEIGIASYNDKYWLINPDIFNDIVANKKVNDDLEYDEFAELFKLPPLEQIDTNKLTDNILQTNHSDQDLQKRLRSIELVFFMETTYFPPLSL